MSSTTSTTLVNQPAASQAAPGNEPQPVDSGDDEIFDPTKIEPKVPVYTLNDPEALRKGLIKTTKSRTEYTILLVGETGVGKTSVLSLIANVLEGTSPSQFRRRHETQNENKAEQSESQTNFAHMYEFVSTNGVKFRILDTPGLGDTRGLGKDEEHKKSIATGIGAAITTVNMVLVLVNGTDPRFSIATDYALNTLMAIFPKKLINNIALLFTNCRDRFSLNLKQSALPEQLRQVPLWSLDNPVAMKDKYDEDAQEARELKAKGASKAEMQDVNVKLRGLWQTLIKTHETTLEMLVQMIDWMDSREPQATNEVMTIYNKTEAIRTAIENALASFRDSTHKEVTLRDIKDALKNGELTKRQYQNYSTVIENKGYRLVPTGDDKKSTLCNVSDCYKNCHEDCILDWTIDSEKLAICAAFTNEANEGTKDCVKCGHPRGNHHHAHQKWEFVVDRKTEVNKEWERLFKEASTDVASKKASIQLLDGQIADLAKNSDEQIALVGQLAEEYAGIALVGSFVGQVEKSVKLLEANVDQMRTAGKDLDSINRVDASLTTMKDRLKVLRAAQEKKKTGITGAITVVAEKLVAAVSTK